MRRGHFILIFCIIFFGSLIGLGVREYRNRALTKERLEIEDAFVKAADVAAGDLALGMNNDLEETLSRVSEDFFASLSANLYLYEDVERSTEVALYVPLLVVTDTEGFYLCVLERVSSTEGTVLSRRWTECLPYTYEDEEFLYRLYLDGRIRTVHKDSGEIVMTTYEEVLDSDALNAYYAGSRLFISEEEYAAVQRAAVAESIEKQVSIVLANQSYIAGSYGINISYTCPSFLSVIPVDSRGTFLALYQGLPSVVGVGYEYSGVKAASYIKEKTMYYVAEPQEGAYYRLAHKEGCAILHGGEVGPVESDVAVIAYGAYGCPSCISEVEGFVYPP